MQHAKQIINSEQLRQFSPLNKLSDEDAQELLRTSIVVRLSAGTPVFNKTGNNNQLFYLIEGEIELLAESKQRALISANSKEAQQALGPHIQGQHSAIARTDVTLLSFDTDMMELFLNWTNPDAYLVNEMTLKDNHDGLERLLQSRGLLRFSEEQIQSLLNRMKEIHFKAGDTVIRQNDYDEYYYIVKNGRCSVSRRPDEQSNEIKLAELKEGDAFGEEAILSHTPRNANVKMLEDGDLMRLSKKDFSEFLAEPLLTTISIAESRNMLAMGAVFLDVRLPEEFARAHIPGSINIPVSLLRLKLSQLSHHRKYIVCCDDASRSAIAAFLLSRHGFDAFILDGGLATTPHLMKQTEPLLEDVVKMDNKAWQKHTSQTIASTTAQRAATAKTAETAKATVTQIPVRPRIKSLADHWGNTVGDDDSIFVDHRDINPSGKTQPLTPPKTSQDIAEKNIQQPRDAENTDTKKIHSAMNAAGFAELTRRKRHKRIIRTTVAAVLVGTVAVISLPMLGSKISQSVIDSLKLNAIGAYLAEHGDPALTATSVPATVSTTENESAVQALETTAPIETVSTQPDLTASSLTPWIDAPEDELSNLLVEINLGPMVAGNAQQTPAETDAEAEQAPAVDPSTRNIISIE